MAFEFVTANRIIFGNGTLKQIADIAPAMGRRALVVTGGTPERAAPLLDILKGAGIEYQTFPVPKEPTIPLVGEGADIVRRDNIDMVISFGGGSPIDAGKAIAAMATNGGEPLDYLEVIGKGQPLTEDPIPMIAIPTTSGTGAEVAKNAVLKSEEHNVKVSLRHPKMLPNVALVDPELTYSVPPNVTAYTGMDALAQVLEPFVTRFMNPLTDAIVLEGLRRAARSLRTAYAQGDNVQAREDMALVSLFGGLALTNAKLGAAHGFAGPLGGMYDAPHGAIVAALLPHVMAVNVDAMSKRDPDNPALMRYHELGVILTGDVEANAADAAGWVRDTAEALNIKSLSRYGMTREDFPAIYEKAKKSSSMKGNPVTLTEDEMGEILTRAL